jgi:hypothetical protein
LQGKKHNINIRNRNTSNFNTVGATLIIYWINIFWPGHTQGLWVKWIYWCDSHQDTLGPHIYSFAGKNSRVALKTRRHGLVSPWLAKHQRAKKGPATGCTAWIYTTNANRRLISPNIALQRDSLRKSKELSGLWKMSPALRRTARVFSRCKINARICYNRSVKK